MTGFVVTHIGMILKTDDGGYTWQIKHDLEDSENQGFSFYLIFQNIDFVDNTLWMGNCTHIYECL